MKIPVQIEDASLLAWRLLEGSRTLEALCCPLELDGKTLKMAQTLTLCYSCISVIALVTKAADAVRM